MEVEGVSQNALPLYGPGPGDINVELLHARLRLFFLRILRLKLCYLRLGVFVLNGPPDQQTNNLVPVVVDHDSPAVDLAHHNFESGLACLVTEVDAFKTRRPVILAVVEGVRIFAGRENNVPVRNEEDTITVVAFAEIETTSTLEVREGFARSGEIWRHRAGVNRPCTSAVGCTEGTWSRNCGLADLVTTESAEWYFDVHGFIIGENLLAAYSRGISDVAGESRSSKCS